MLDSALIRKIARRLLGPVKNPYYLGPPTDEEVARAIYALPEHFSSSDLVPFSNWPPPIINAEMTHTASVATSIGDMVYYDTSTHTIKPVSQIADQAGGNGLATQALMAPTFCGVANSRQRSTDATARNARVLIDGIYDYPCTSSAYEVGDLVTPKWTTVTGLSDQLLEKTTSPSIAIGYAVKRYSAATTKVKCRIIGKFLMRPLETLTTQQNPPVPSSVPSGSGTLTPSAYSTSAIVAPAGAVTGMIIAVGTVDGQRYTVINNSANSLTMATAATSHVADGTSDVIAAWNAREYIWAATPALWFPKI